MGRWRRSNLPRSSIQPGRRQGKPVGGRSKETEPQRGTRRSPLLDGRATPWQLPGAISFRTLNDPALAMQQDEATSSARRGLKLSSAREHSQPIRQVTMSALQNAPGTHPGEALAQRSRGCVRQEIQVHSLSRRRGLGAAVGRGKQLSATRRSRTPRHGFPAQRARGHERAVEK